MPAPLVYGAYTQPQLDAQYDTALSAQLDVTTYLERFAALSETARAEFTKTTFPYGRHPRQVLDFFAAPQPGAPLFVWMHGGYWRRLSKDDCSFIVPPLVRAGVAVAIPSYPLAPEASLDDIVASVRSAYVAALDYGKQAKTDPERVFVGGHSVGAQLAGMVAATYEPRGVFALSGLYDLEPVRLSKINETIAMDAEQARRYSPLYHLPSRPGTLLLGTGAYEQDEFHRQQRAYAQAWRASGGDVRELAVPEHDHFSIVLALADERTELSRALREFIRAG
jgi:arylformamidase